MGGGRKGFADRKRREGRRRGAGGVSVGVGASVSVLGTLVVGVDWAMTAPAGVCAIEVWFAEGVRRILWLCVASSEPAASDQRQPEKINF